MVCGDIPPIDKSILISHPRVTDVVQQIYVKGGKVDLLIGTNFPITFKETTLCCSTDQSAPIVLNKWRLVGSRLDN